MLSLFGIFIIELIAFRVGSAKLAALGMKHGKFVTLQSVDRYSLLQIPTDTELVHMLLTVPRSHMSSKSVCPTQSPNCLWMNRR